MMGFHQMCVDFCHLFFDNCLMHIGCECVCVSRPFTAGPLLFLHLLFLHHIYLLMCCVAGCSEIARQPPHAALCQLKFKLLEAPTKHRSTPFGHLLLFRASFGSGRASTWQCECACGKQACACVWRRWSSMQRL